LSFENADCFCFPASQNPLDLSVVGDRAAKEANLFWRHDSMDKPTLEQSVPLVVGAVSLLWIP
jgi:hypothetical protein